MPPPPPPSKSYLLVFDTDSEDEEEEERVFHERPMVVTPPPTPPPEDPMSAEEEVEEVPDRHGQRRHLSVNEDDDDDDDDDSNDPPLNSQQQLQQQQHQQNSQKTSKNKKKKNKKRENKKKKRSTSLSLKSVQFSGISIREYARCFGPDVVPGDGGWPLGLELSDYTEVPTIPIDEYEQEKQARLQERWERVQSKCSDDVVAMVNKSSSFETRMWGYKRGLKNPLFQIVLEDERQALLLGTIQSWDEDISHSITCDTSSLSSSPPKQRLRSNSVASEKSSRLRSNSHDFSEKYDQVYVHHVRNDLEQIRNSRTKEGATGCTCRKLSVYIPPKDGSGGKRAQHRRLKPSKLTAELKKRGLDVPANINRSREESEQVLHDAVEQESCCWGDDCFCARNGIDCQADACACWHNSHVNTKSSGGGYLGPADIEKRCGNPNGMYTVNLDEINAFREKLLSNPIMICQPVTSSSSM
jgi:hypothetical protein